MKKKTKSSLIFLSISVALILALFVTVIAATGIARSTDGETLGRAFIANENYIADKNLSAMPGTFEAVIKLDSAYTERAGAIISNYRESYDWCDEGFGLEINTNGRPRLYIDNGVSSYDINFDANVATGEWVHLAVTYDKTSGSVECFVDGESVGVNSMLVGVSIGEKVISDRPLMIGGDYRRYNTQYFKGEIASVALFSDVRASDEIALDCQNGVQDDESGLLSLYDLSNVVNESIPDLSGNGYDVSEKMFLNEDEYTRVEDFDYSFAIVGDTQRISELYPDALTDMYQWIVDNQQKEKIEFVFGLGDITEQSKITEWNAAKNALALLENAKIPYSLSRGNHDMKSDNPNDSERCGMNSGFANHTPYTSQFGGFFEEGDVTNSWRAQRVGEIDYLFLTLDYGASDAMLAWASEVVESHPNHRVIVVTHGYEYYTGNKLGFDLNKGTPPAASNDYEFKKYEDNPNVRDYNHGVDIWNEFASKHGNIFLILSGHEASDDIIYHQEQGIHSNTVTSFLINPQGADDKFEGLGMICLFKFSNDGREIYIEYYSVMKGQYFKTLNQITLDVPDESYDGHNVERYSISSAASCSANAFKTGICVDCGKTVTVEIEGTKLSHAVISYETVENADCEGNAKQKGVCAICNEEVIREIPNSALGHDYEDGQCAVCKKSNTDEEEENE